MARSRSQYPDPNDPFDPRGWEWDLPYKTLYLQADHLYTFLDEQDYHWAIQWLWFVVPSGYAVRSKQVDGKHKMIWLHKEVLKRAKPQPSPKHHIGDHLNGVRNDNRRCNLRWATPSMNGQNKHGFYVKQPDLFTWRYGND